jgi:acyl dehydratase
MYFEDMQIGRVTDLGSASFTRDSILAYARQFDPRVLLRADVGAPLAASALHVASAAMRRLIETRAALRAAMAARGETAPDLGVSPGFRDMRWPHPVLEGDVVSFSMEIVSKRETSKPSWGLVVNSLRGINQRGENVLSFSGAVLAVRRTAEK